MARLKRQSRELTAAKQRRSALELINNKLDFGEGLSLANFAADIEGFDTALEQYNTLLTTVDQMALRINEQERKLTTLSSRLLAAVGSRYGKDSGEYALAGAQRRGKAKPSGIATPMPTAEPVTIS